MTKEEKQNVLNHLREVIKQNTGPLKLNKDSEKGIELIGNVPTSYGSKNVIVPGMFFASAKILTSSIAFHFFPIYMRPEAFKGLAPDTFKKLKGKTCFHFKTITDINEIELAAMFKAGIEGYKKQGWIK